jgi:hypothetical protein
VICSLDIDSDSNSDNSRRHYSKDLKDRIIYQYNILKMKPPETAISLNMSTRVVYQTLQLWEEIGNIVQNLKNDDIHSRPKLMNETACNVSLFIIDLTYLTTYLSPVYDETP